MPERAKALGIPVSQWSLLQRGQTVRTDGRTVSPADVLGPARKGLKLLYATDTRAISSISDLGRDADLLILEGLYGDETLRQKAFDRGHMTMLQAAQLAKDAGRRGTVADPLQPVGRGPFGVSGRRQPRIPQRRHGTGRHEEDAALSGILSVKSKLPLALRRESVVY